MNFPAVLFDLDGTLLDTLDDLAGSTNLAMRKLGLPEHPAEAFKQFVGDGIEISFGEPCRTIAAIGSRWPNV